MKKPRLNFADLRAQASFQTVCAHYNIALTRDGSRPQQWKALCPFHDDQNPSLKINAEKNIFHCFACEAKGNILEFVMQHEGLELRPAAERLAEICGLTPAPSGKGRRQSAPKPTATPPPAPPPAELAPAEPPAANPPLTFTLQLVTDQLHPWLEGRGITAAMAETFGLGLATRGSLKDHIAIPIHNAAGALVAYCGRYPADTVPDDQAKYRLPKGFHKELEVFNLHRLPRDPKAVVLVESYLSVIKLHSWGLPTVSLMGRSLAPTQAAALEAWGIRRVVVMFDGDEPGRDGARAVAGDLAGQAWVRIATLPDGQKPHHLDEATIRATLRSLW